MKEILKQLGQLIFKHKKRLIYGALAFFVGQICFFNLGGVGIQSEAYAEDGETATQREDFSKIVTEKAKLFDLYRKTGYVLLYPVVFLAGKLVDNSFVYGEVFGFDAVLWKLWNMVRNFANFGLGFIFLYYIFRFLIKNDKNKDWKRLIGRAMIAGIGIQASWFIMAALIDISTILIYGIGGLPLSILGGDENAGKEGFNPYVLKTVVTIDANKPGDLRGVYFTNTSGNNLIYISECQTTKLKSDDEKRYVVAPKLVYYWNGIKGDKAQYIGTEGNWCHYMGGVYKIDNLPITFPGKCGNETDCINKQSEYNTALESFLKAPEADKVLPIGVVSTGGGPGLDEDNKSVCDGNKCKKLSELMAGDVKSYVGVFSTLYSSLLEAGRNMVPMDTGVSNYVQFLSIFMALAHVIAIGIPLVAALLVFIMRIGVLWVAITISPMIILLSAFGFMDKIKTDSMKYFKLDNLIGIIFAPAVITFAVSLSTVLVRLIEKINYKPIATDTIVLGGLVQMNLAGFAVGLSELIIAVMGAAISWFLVWTAVEMSALGGKGGIVESVKNLATSALGSVPIVPIVGRDANGKLTGELASVSGVKNAVNNKIQSVKSEFVDSDTQAVEELLNPSVARKKAAERSEKYDVKTFVDGLKEAPNVTEYWANFDKYETSQKEAIITSMNNTIPAERLKDISEKIGSIKFDVGSDKKEYVFDGSKYVPAEKKS